MATKGKKRPREEKDDGVKSKKGKTNTQLTWDPAEELAFLCGQSGSVSRNICRMLDEGCTIPFIARYRRQATANMDPDNIRHFREQYETFKEVKEKGEKLLKKLESMGQLNPPLKHSVLACKSPEELDLLAAPFKSNKQTLANRARQLMGLEEAANCLLDPFSKLPNLHLLVDKSVEGKSSLDKVEESISHIATDVMVHAQPVMQYVNDKLVSDPRISVECCSKKSKTKLEDVYKNYADFKCPVKSLKPHQVLAINRAEKKKQLVVTVEVPQQALNGFEWHCKNIYLAKSEVNKKKKEMIVKAIQDGYKRLVKPMVQRRIRSMLSRDAENASLGVFADNLRHLLLTPPCRGVNILGIDPGFKHGCKLACINGSGEVEKTGIVHPQFGNYGLNKQDQATLLGMVESGKVDVIAIGNGTGCRPVEQLVSSMIKSGAFGNRNKISYVIVNEDGASIYSCSTRGMLEHPGMDTNLISAVSIARRLQDPLTEYVKIGPGHLGVGMYQHDVPEAKLSKTLEEIVTECVSFVGVDVNTAPAFILQHVSGISAKVAEKIVKRRTEKGRFKSRSQLLDIRGLGPKAYEQCAGFVKIMPEPKSVKGGKQKCYNALDSTLIHPEAYDLTQRLLTHQDFCTDDIGTDALVQHFSQLNLEALQKKMTGKYTDEELAMVPQIVDALQLKNTADIRDQLAKPLFRSEILSMDCLKAGQIVTGAVKNVTHFGAFVDIGVGKDALLHSSQMKGSSLKLGQRIQVEVVKVEKDRGRINLSLLKIL